MPSSANTSDKANQIWVLMEYKTIFCLIPTNITYFFEKLINITMHKKDVTNEKNAQPQMQKCF